MPQSAAEASLNGRIAALERWAKTDDRSAATLPARKGLQARFEREVDPDGELDPAERAHRAGIARRAYFTRLALKSARSRRAAAEARIAARERRTRKTARQVADELRSAADQLDETAAEPPETCTG